MIKQMPDFLKPELTIDSQHEKIFKETESRISFLTPTACCGKAIDHCFIDEAALFDRMEDHWKCFYPIIAVTGSACIVSTPKKRKDWFYDTYQKALDGENKFQIYSASFMENPSMCSEKWIEEMKKSLGAIGWSQEVLQEFGS